MNSKWESVYCPQWNADCDLPSFLEDIAAQMRRGDYNPSCEALVLTMDSETEIVTVHRWGERSGLCSEETLLDIAKLSRTMQ